jgi:hypothetical protein
MMLSKCKEYFFNKSHDIENKLLIIIHVDKMSVQKDFFLKQNLELFLEPFALEPIKVERVISLCTFINGNITDTRTNHLLSRKRNNS